MPQKNQSYCIYILGLTVMCLFVFPRNAGADTVYLKNGNTMEGVIVNEDENEIEIQVCFGGSVKLNKNSIVKTEKSSQQGLTLLRGKWEREKQEFQERLQKQRMAQEQKPKPIVFSDENRGIVVEVTINKSVKASLVLDTGASVVMLTKSVAKKLGIDLSNAGADTKVSVADGRKLDATRIILESVQLQDMEATNIEAAVLLEDTQEEPVGDGLLGMSFLSKFIFKIDHKGKKVILEKLP